MNAFSTDIHIWYLFYTDVSPAVLSDCYTILSEDEKHDYNQYKLKKVASQYLLTRFLVRTLLSYYVDDVEVTAWKFTKNQYGKPSVIYPLLQYNLSFNVSHTKEAIVVALGNYNYIGVDIEYLCHKNNIIDIARNFFSPVELQQLQQLSGDEQQKRFFDLWTLKEAYIKAVGQGLSMSLDQFSFTFTDLEQVHISFAKHINDQPDDWKFWRFTLQDTYRLALACKVSDNINKPLVTLNNYKHFSRLC